MARVRNFVGPFSVSVCLWLAACSLQNFDYLKGEYKSSVAGAGGSSAMAGGASASGGSNAGGAGGKAGEASTPGGTTAIAGTSGNVGGTDAGSGDAGAGGEGGAAPVPPGMLVNPGFELGSDTNVVGWTSTGTTAAATVVFGDAHTGSGRLGHWLMAGAYQVSTFQTVSPLPNGNYTFSMWVRHSTVLNSEYIFAKGYAKGQPAAQMKLDTTDATDAVGVYTQIILQHIPVTNGQVEVGIYTDGPNDSSINWSLIDDALLTLEP